MASSPPRLVVNADDFGYFPQVSQGIRESIEHGIVTATAVIINRATDSQVYEDFKALRDVDRGVHLNLTHGEPLSDPLREATPGGLLPGKFGIAKSIATGKISVDMILSEWREQISRVRDSGVTPDFLNCHEHLHMFPGLFPRFVDLADHFNIPHIRYCTPEWRAQGSAGHLLRTAIFFLIGLTTRRPARPSSAQLIGLAPSGDLNRSYLEQLLPGLKADKSYELMCHPGHGVSPDSGDLVQYHRWDSERSLLCDPSTRELIDSHGVVLSRFTGVKGS